MSREVAEAIASYFEAIGIRTKLVGEEFVSFEKRQRASKGPEAEYVNLGTKGRAGGSDPSYFLDLFFSGDGGFSLYDNPELDKIIAEAKTSVDEVKRGELIKKAVRLIHEEVPTIPIYNTVSVYVMKKNVDFKPTLRHTHDLVLVKDITVR
jgi:ABC-type transport system substrate-binding protein